MKLHTIGPELDKQPKQRPILGLVAAGIIVVVAAVAVIALANRSREVVATPLGMADSVMNALNAHDVDACTCR